jgi:sugar lactone lactonase YvrE
VIGATVASERAYGLAEGPVWDPERERILWVDINRGDVHIGRLRDSFMEPAARVSFEETVGAVVCAQDGRLLVAGARDLYMVDVDGRRSRVASLVGAQQASRLNDGACDPAGRFLVGSMALDERAGQERLYRLDADGEVAVIDDDLTLSNGLAWSPEGSVLYSVDTTPGVVWSRSYEVASGARGERAVALQIDDGSPDGLCVDADGNLWIAIWGGSRVECRSPKGELLATVTTTAPHTTSVAFAGPALDILVITTATDELEPAELAAAPDSGRLFTAEVGVPGRRTPYWQAVL